MIDADNHPKANQTGFRQCLKGTWSDRLVLISMLMGIGFLWLQINQSLSQGVPTAYIYHGKQLLASYPLPNDETVIHMPAKGELGISDIEISKLGIRFISSPCTTHHCMLSGHKKYTGSVIACVPNHIVVVIRGFDKKTDEIMRFDAISE